MDSKIHVVQATVSNDRGGLTWYILQNYRLIDKEKFDFSLLTYEDKLDFKAGLYKKGKEIVKIVRPTQFCAYYRSLKKIRRNKNDIIHFNLSYANFIPIIIARLAGYKNIIVHSHSTEIDDGNTIKKFCKKVIHLVGKHVVFPYVVTDFWACSQLAAKWMYPTYIRLGIKFFHAHNAIDLESYKFNKHIRTKKRLELGLKDTDICLGHIGRFSYQKNHIFLIELLEQLQQHQEKNRFKLLLVGTWLGGETYYNEVVKKISEYQLENNVLILGARNDINELFLAMDYFLLPSRFEGLPLVGIEAQASGIPCIFSKKITKELKINENVDFLETNNIYKWKNYILSNTNYLRLNEQRNLEIAGYSINKEIIATMKRYCKVYKGE